MEMQSLGWDEIHICAFNYCILSRFLQGGSEKLDPMQQNNGESKKTRTKCQRVDHSSEASKKTVLLYSRFFEPSPDDISDNLLWWLTVDITVPKPLDLEHLGALRLRSLKESNASEVEDRFNRRSAEWLQQHIRHLAKGKA